MSTCVCGYQWTWRPGSGGLMQGKWQWGIRKHQTNEENNFYFKNVAYTKSWTENSTSATDFSYSRKTSPKIWSRPHNTCKSLSTNTYSVPNKHTNLKATVPRKWVSTVHSPSLLLYIKISMERWTWEKPGPQVSWYDDRKVTLDHQDDRQQPASSCLDRSEILENVFEQLLHWYFLTSECVCRWARRLERSANARLQWGHENGFSPEARAHYYIIIYFWDC